MYRVVFSSGRLDVGANIAETPPGKDAEKGFARQSFDVDHLFDLPQLDHQPDQDTDADHEVGVVVPHVEQDHHRLEDVEEDRPHRETFQRATIAPKLDICRMDGNPLE